jgi:hypothetical protein
MIPLLAAGMTPKQIAAELGCSREHVYAVKNNDEVREELAQYQREVSLGFQQALVTEVARDGLRNLKFLKRVRSGKIEAKGEQLRVRVAAATALLDRQLPKRTEVTEDRTIRLLLQPAERQALEAMVVEVDKYSTPQIEPPKPQGES